MLKMRTSCEVASIAPRLREEQGEAVLVCVTKQQSCRDLIHKGALMAKEKGMRLLVLSVQPKQNLRSLGGDVLEQLFAAATEYQAEMSVYYSDDTIGMANAYIRRNHIVHCVTGVPSSRGKFVRNLEENHPHITLHWSAENGESEKDVMCG